MSLTTVPKSMKEAYPFQSNFLDIDKLNLDGINAFFSFEKYQYFIFSLISKMIFISF